MKSRLLIILVMLGFGAIVVGWVYESRLRPEVAPSELVIPENIDYFLTRFSYRVMNADGALDYEFTSPRLEHYPLTDVSQIEMPSLRIHRDPDRWQVDAGRGEFRHEQDLFELTNQVVMRRLGDRPFELLSEHIRFEVQREFVISDGPVVMRTPNARIEAERAEFDLAAGVYRFNGTRAIYTDESS